MPVKICHILLMLGYLKMQMALQDLIKVLPKMRKCMAARCTRMTKYLNILILCGFLT